MTLNKHVATGIRAFVHASATVTTGSLFRCRPGMENYQLLKASALQLPHVATRSHQHLPVENSTKMQNACTGRCFSLVEGGVKC